MIPSSIVKTRDGKIDIWIVIVIALKVRTGTHLAKVEAVSDEPPVLAISGSDNTDIFMDEGELKNLPPKSHKKLKYNLLKYKDLFSCE